MTVTIKLFATFQRGRFAVSEREVPLGTTLAVLVDELAIPRSEIGVMLVSGRHAELDHAPPPGSTVSIFPLLGGG